MKAEGEHRKIGLGQRGREPKRAAIDVQRLVTEGLEGVAQREEAADSVVEGAEALITGVDGPDIVKAQLEVPEVVLRSAQRVAVNRDGNIFGEVLRVGQILDAAGAG